MNSTATEQMLLPTAVPVMLQGLDAATATVVAHIPIVFLLAQHPKPLELP